VRTIGRKGAWDEWLTDDGLLQIQGWAREGLTEEQLAHNIGIGLTTLKEWKNKFPTISTAIKKGKAPVDLEVENALLKRALGYQYEEIITEIEEVPTGKLDESGKPIVKQQKHIRKITKTALPDTTAQIFWLKNRRPGRWRDKIEAAPDTTNELLQSLMELERRSKHD
jgi:hypothetical protein